MQNEVEATRFLEWLAGLGQKEPLAKEGVHGKVFDVGERPPKFGFKIQRVYAKGTLTLWDDALVFIARPPKGGARTFASAAISEIATKATRGISSVLGAIAGAVSGGASAEKLLEMALNPWSSFIPLRSIDRIDGGKGFWSFFIGQSLDVFYEDMIGERVRAYFWSSDRSFSSYSLRKSIDAAIAALDREPEE